MTAFRWPYNSRFGRYIILVKWLD
ncbi:hypothetical protein CGRA01v4_00679 [Colletotrichum graminicola]|nr:hypothetical protein CGRA01v4_00679 [Colletotrichum graminicola]